MRTPWANISLLTALTLLIVSGWFGLLTGKDARSFWLLIHSVSAYALLIIMGLKSMIVTDAVKRKKTWTWSRIGFMVIMVMLVMTIFMGLIWTFNGPVYVGGFSLVSLHIYIGVPMMALMAWHTWKMRFVFKVKGTFGRRLFLGTSLQAVAGAFLWRGTEFGKSLYALEGAARRFTGSYERGSFTGRFPSVSWIFDYPNRINQESWQLSINGAVANMQTFALPELHAKEQVEQQVLLDCTSGWYTTQIWRGVSLKSLLDEAGLLDSAQSISVIAISGYQRRFPMSQLDALFLATHVADEPLSHGHGAPVRLVVPNHRGYEWVKWVSRIEVNTTSAYLQSPLPLQ